jgi:RNA-directed DNA polymerase
MWLMKCLKERINDPNLLWLIHKMLKAGIMEDGAYKVSNEGTPQGGVISPILANIYLHYVVDAWYEIQFKNNTKSYIEIIRYCDDLVGLFESKNDTEAFLSELEVRLAKFGLKLSKDKTRSIKFGRQTWKEAKRKGCKVETFDFLGFTHICATSKNGYFYFQHQTSSRRLSAALNKTKIWLKKARCMISLKEIMDTVKKKLIGHYNYYGVNGNHRKLVKYYKGMCKLVYKWINRRGKKSLSFTGFKQYLMWNPLPAPTIRVQIWEPRTNVS